MDYNKGVLIVGAMPQGLQAALTLANCGRRVAIVEKNCEIKPPFRRWSDQGKRWHQYLISQISYHPLIELHTDTEITAIKEGKHGAEVEWNQRPQWVVPDLCVDCQICLSSCPVELPEGKKPIFRLNAPSSMAVDKRQKAPCRSACPIDMNPQGYVALISQGRFNEAYDLILDKNPLPGICGRVCHHPCERECRRQEVDDPIALCALKRFAVDKVRESGNRSLRQAMPQPDAPRIAIIGSGPAGLTAAHDLAKAGFRPTLIEADDKLGGLLRQGIAPYRLPREIIEEEIEQILKLGVDVRFNSPVTSAEDLEKLKEEGFEKILLATGASKDLKMNIRGEEIQGIHGCVSFLKKLWIGIVPESLGEVAVIGGGNAAIEAARASVRTGAQSVTLLYRRTKKEMPADPHEVEQAIEEGVKFMFLTTPVAFEEIDDRLARIRCLEMELKEVDASGRPRPIPIYGSDFLVKADTAIVAIGQRAHDYYGILKNPDLATPGILENDSEEETEVRGIYAAGDLVKGPTTVVEAMASGRRAAERIMHDLKPTERPHSKNTSESPYDDYDPIPKTIQRQSRRSIPHRMITERIKDSHEVIGPYSEDVAIEEASRCLQCGVCSECLRCETSCELDAICHDRKTTKRTEHFDQVILAEDGQGILEKECSRVLRIGDLAKTTSWARAMVAGRAVALEALSGTSPAVMETISKKHLGDDAPRIGVFICSCNGTLDLDGQLDRMIAPLGKIQGVTHAEVLTSACHPEKGQMIEKAIQEKGLNGALIASCACCHLDFACESCNDQRIRLKHRLFGESGFEPRDIALVNIKETCLIPFQSEKERLGRASSVIRSGLHQLKHERAWSLMGKTPPPCPAALVLGATEAGIATAMSLKGQFSEVLLADERKIDRRRLRLLQDSGIRVIASVRPVRLDGQRGRFHLIVERVKSSNSKRAEAFRPPGARTRKMLLSMDGKAFEEAPGYERIEAGIILLGRKEFKDIPYKRDDFAQSLANVPKKAFGSLETAIPGVYMASWSQVRGVSEGILGKSAAAEAIEGIFEKIHPGHNLVARVDAEFCRGCGKCADICPEGAAHLEEIPRGTASSRIEPLLCTGCGNCLAECPTGSILLPEAEQEYFQKVINAFLE